MEWLNVFGLMFMCVIMIPNAIFALKQKGIFNGKYKNKALEITEQLGRFGCFGFMIFNVPATWLGWWSDEAFAVYLIVNALLVALYYIVWVICWRKNSKFRALALSVIPSALFLFSGIMSRSALLIFSALLFAPTHIFISYKNA